MPGQRDGWRCPGAYRCWFDPDPDNIAACGRIVIDVMNVAAKLQADLRIHGTATHLA